jgi:hypothetical protein
MNLPLPEADAATAAEIRDWLDRFAACVREVDYAAARPFWHPDIVIFGTYQELVKSLTAWTERQWDNVWPRTAEFRFDLANTMVMASPDSGTGAGSACTRTCRSRAACPRIAMANGRSRRGREKNITGQLRLFRSQGASPSRRGQETKLVQLLLKLMFEASSPLRDRVAIPFMVREPHHERNCLIENSSTYPFALSASKGSERIATQSLTGEE